MNQIRIERDGYAIDRAAVKACVDVLLQLRAERQGSNVYKLEMEQSILQESQEFYEAEGNKLLVTCDASEYLLRVRILLLVSKTELTGLAGRGTIYIRGIANTSLPQRAHGSSPPPHPRVNTFNPSPFSDNLNVQFWPRFHG